MPNTRRVSGFGRILVGIASLVVSLSTVPVWAADGDSKLEVHGFLTQAYATTDFVEGPWADVVGITPGEVLLGIPEDGTFAYRNLALQFRYAISENDIMIVQLSHTRTGDSPVEAFEDDVELDWGFYERRFGSDTSLKIGRVQIPFGIYNEIRDVGTVLPFYRPPFSVYLEGSFTSETVDGGVFSHSFGADKAWSLDLDLYYGEFEGAESSPINAADVKPANTDIVGLQLWLNTPHDGTRLGVSYSEIEVTNGQEGFFRPPGGENEAEDLMFSFETIHDRWVARAEYRLFTPTVPSPYPGGGNLDLDLVNYYAQAGWLINDKFHLYLQYENIEQTEKAAGLARDISYNIRTDLGLSLNYFISAQVLAKAEYHEVEAEGPALFPVFGPGGLKLDANILGADNGNYWILALSTSF